MWWMVAVFLLLWAWKSSRRPSWSPPGPTLLPWLGNTLHVLLENPSMSSLKWAETYGKLMYVRFGSHEQVVLNDPDLIREAFSRSETTSRPKMPSFDFLIQGGGLVFSTGELWRESRRFSLHHLKNFGMGKSSMEDAISEQVAGFINHILEPNNHQLIDIDNSLNVAVVNIIWKMITSEHLDIEDASVQRQLEVIDELTTNDILPLKIVECFPFLRNRLPRCVFYEPKVLNKVTDLLEDFLLPVIDDHRQSLDPDAEPRDYIDAILLEQAKRPDLLKDHNVYLCIMDLFVAGNDTTATTLRWAFCFVCNQPETQRRIQEEIDRVTGRSRSVCLSDRANMPYTEAFIHETQRRGDIVPLGVPHATESPVVIGGYNIPAGIAILSNFRAVHNNPAHFQEPNEFRPERFINADGLFVADKKVMPFSTGKRQCLGESMARAELFLFLTMILQKYTLSWQDGFHHSLQRTLKAGLISCPESFKLIPQLRSQ